MYKKTDDGVRGRIEDSFSLNAFNQKPTYTFSRIRLFCIALIGGLLGMALCFAVNAILFEISLSRVFAFYFGIMFCVLGVLMLVRSWYQPTRAKRIAVCVFSILVISAGVCALVFQTNWLWTMQSALKIFVYTILGVATSFAITFAYLDILSFFHDNTMEQQQDEGGVKRLGLFESSNQVWLVLFLSIITGLTYGFTFGMQEEHGLVEAQKDSDTLHVEFFVQSLGKSLLFTLPFGFVLGCLGAAMNEYLRYKEIVSTLHREYEYKPVSTNEIDGL